MATRRTVLVWIALISLLASACTTGASSGSPLILDEVLSIDGTADIQSDRDLIPAAGLALCLAPVGLC